MKKLNLHIKLGGRKYSSERGELLKWFKTKLDPSYKKFTGKELRYAFLNMKISHLTLEDLYYLKSTLKDVDSRGGDMAKAFWGSIK